MITIPMWLLILLIIASAPAALFLLCCLSVAILYLMDASIKLFARQ